MPGVGTLATERYINLTTFRRNGTPATTPVWVVSDDSRRLLVWTSATSYKVKRLKRDSRVLVAAADYRGRPRGEAQDGIGRLLDSSEGSLVEPLLAQKYGLARRLLHEFNRLVRALSSKPPT